MAPATLTLIVDRLNKHRWQVRLPQIPVGGNPSVLVQRLKIAVAVCHLMEVFGGVSHL